MEKKSIKDLLKIISPFLINPHNNSITISMSKRFFLFQMIGKLIGEMEEDPFLNFISILKNYKVLGRVLHGTIEEFYKDRNKFYFKKFFMDQKLYVFIKEDIENLYPQYQDIKVMIAKDGLIIYDNYKKNDFNVLLLTTHAGQWVPEILEKKMEISKKARFREEDIDSDKLYSKIVLEKGGIWVNTKISRFVCDCNRTQPRCIYHKEKEKWLHKAIWKDTLNKHDINRIYSWHSKFYTTLAKLLEAYNFNIIFDGHTMKQRPGRPRISFGTKYISDFYKPIVRSMGSKLRHMGYRPLRFNKPYAGGFILKWLKTQFPDRFIFSMEINKRIYMKPNRTKTLKRKLNKIRDDLPHIFELE